jgi:glyoxylase-like metal-dependent hydrolase (beta-lactamase superfamily II)
MSAAVSALAQDDRFANVSIETVPVTGNISMLIGSGGNIGVSAGDDGLLIIDDQYAPLAAKIRAALSQLGAGTPKFLLNTHFHGDHTGSNADFGAASIIIAHENVRGRLVAGDSPNTALPVVTFDDDVTVHFNGENITLIHMPRGHTDSDSVVVFESSNVIHMGDHFFNGSFPFVDLASGGTVQGYLNNLEKALSWIDDDTSVIPGHGPLGTKADLLAFYNVVKDTSISIRVMKSQQMSVEEAVAEGLSDGYESWGQGFVNEQRWIETVFASYPR